MSSYSSSCSWLLNCFWIKPSIQITYTIYLIILHEQTINWSLAFVAYLPIKLQST
ncbi:hypothetical protein F5880DRAFT_1719110 [Lentinula raphanica]|nr:hypothetical protein F5880DRAFT_1719110 [Lentinula raphanica]